MTFFMEHKEIILAIVGFLFFLVFLSLTSQNKNKRETPLENLVDFLGDIIFFYR